MLRSFSRDEGDYIPFTLYMRPHGRTKQIFFRADTLRHDRAYDRAYEFIQRGGVFEAEVLTTGHVSLTAALPVDGELRVIAIEVCPGGPQVLNAVERLVDRAHALSEDF